ncbi:MAG: hypothetical protein J6K37_03925 [Lachnospiraceae bacterium]|nr:hypothetical protein [Lachnospiraceae bacterium]
MLPILASLFIITLIISHALKKEQRESEKVLNEYFSRERAANRTRRQPLDDLAYVEIPFDFIPKSLLEDNETVQDCHRILEGLSDKKIVNFTGYTNTDLKLQYGVSNLATLTAYDENYTLYARTIYKLAKLYYDNGYESNARILLEKAIESGTDITANYTLLASIYQTKGEYDKINNLLTQADTLRSASKGNIKRSLEEYVRTD